MCGIPGQPFAFGTVGGTDDADRVTTLHWQIVLANFAGYHHLSMVHGFLQSSDLSRQPHWKKLLYFSTFSTQ